MKHLFFWYNNNGFIIVAVLKCKHQHISIHQSGITCIILSTTVHINLSCHLWLGGVELPKIQKYFLGMSHIVLQTLPCTFEVE